MRHHALPRRALVGLAVALVVTTTTAPRRADEPNGDWPAYAGSNASLKYSPLDQINKNNVKNLRIAWRQSAMPMEVRRGRSTVSVATNYQVTPLMVDGLLYISTGEGSIAALNPGSGAVVWSYVPPSLLRGPPPAGNEPARETLGGRSANRGLAYYADGKDGRIVAISGRSLIELNAKTRARVIHELEFAAPGREQRDRRGRNGERRRRAGRSGRHPGV
jgi:glucose dehydrogenase